MCNRLSAPYFVQPHYDTISSSEVLLFLDLTDIGNTLSKLHQKHTMHAVPDRHLNAHSSSTSHPQNPRAGRPMGERREAGKWAAGQCGGGKRSQWARAAHPGSAAPPPAVRFPEGRALGHARLPWRGSPAHAKGAGLVAAIAACLGTTNVHPGALGYS